MASIVQGFNPFPWIALLPAVFSVVLFLSSQNALRRMSSGRLFLTILIFLSLWSACYFLAMRAPSPGRAQLWISVSTAYLLLLPSLSYLFNLSILKPTGASPGTRFFLLGLAAVLVVLHLATGCFVQGIYRYPWGYFPRYGLAFLLFLAFFLMVQVRILYDACRHYRSAPPGAIRSRNLLLLTAWVVGFLGFPDFLLGYGVAWVPLSGLPMSYFLVVVYLLFRRYGITDFFQYMGLESILRFSKDPILLIRVDGTLQYLNRETAGMLGYEAPETLAGTPVNSLFAPDTPLFTQGQLASLDHRQHLPARTLRLKTLSGATIPVRVEMSAVFNKRDEMLGLVAIGRDIREELRKEEELLRVNRSFREKIREVEERTEELTEANQALESNRTAMLNILEDMEESHGRLEDAYRRLSELDRTKDIFLSSVSHELRTPLTSIRSFSEILLQYPTEEKEVQQEFLSIIHQESERLTRLVNDLLDIAKIESGKNNWKRERVNVREVFALAAQTFSVLAREKQLVFRQSAEEDLPDLLIDRDRFYQVISNLLTNAIKFTPEKGSILLRAETVKPAGDGNRDGILGPHLKVEVRDNGRGIRPEDLPFIFEKFRQGGGDMYEKPQGTGLGLAICKEIVQYYGGRIWAESEAGKGCSVSFTIPLRGNSEPAGQNLQERDGAADGPRAQVSHHGKNA